MERILIIGANGQIGSELVTALAEQHGANVASARTAVSALASALEIFDGLSLELLNSAPPDLLRLLQSQPSADSSADAAASRLPASERGAV